MSLSGDDGEAVALLLSSVDVVVILSHPQNSAFHLHLSALYTALHTAHVIA